MNGKKITLNVPYDEKDAAKKIGAQWNKEDKTWYIKTNKNGELPKMPEEWLIPEQVFIPKEGAYIYVDLVPESSWLQNLRKELKQKEWDIIKRDVYDKANNVCEACGGEGKKHPVEAHERWEYNTTTKTQRLVNIEALCPACHRVTHIGHTEAMGLYANAVAHMKKVNKWNDKRVGSHVEKAFFEWRERSKIDWKLDMSWILSKYGDILSEETVAKLVKG